MGILKEDWTKKKVNSRTIYLPKGLIIFNYVIFYYFQVPRIKSFALIQLRFI
jgi:hypothetical protein